MQLIHSLTFTGLVVIGAASALFHYREKPHRDVAAVSALLCAVSAAKLMNPTYKDSATAFSKEMLTYLSGLKGRIQ